MILISVMYPIEPGGRFDRDYYLQKHIPLVKERWTGMGLEDVRLVGGLGTPDGGDPPYRVIALLSFRSMPEFQAAAAAHAPEIFADIPAFTDCRPVVQINEDLQGSGGAG